jgi:hypothetical protein
MASDETPLFCDRCSKILEAGRGNFYVVRIEGIADPSPPILEAEVSRGQVTREIDRLLRRISKMTEQELNDQVFRRVILHLCGPCYRVWVENPTGT